MPFVSTLTAQARIAPTAIRKMLTPSPIDLASLRVESSTFDPLAGIRLR
jgi:hypothetical protein